MTDSAWTAVINEDGYSVGLAERGKPGYRPLREPLALPSWAAAVEEADARNAQIGLDRHEASAIVASSMVAQHQSGG